jgi:hypothetical protein
MPEHFISRQLTPVTPTAFFFVNFSSANIHLSGKNRFKISLSALGSSSTRIVHILQPFEEDQITHLLNGSERITDATAPEAVPEGIHLGFEGGVGEHDKLNSS